MIKEKKMFLASICIAVIAVVVVIISILIPKGSGFIPPISVIGDVKNPITVRSLKEIGEIKKVLVNNDTKDAVKLSDFINKAGPLQGVKKIYFMASDGFTSAVDFDKIDESYIYFTSDNGWQVYNEKLPINANAKMIQEIVAVSFDSSIQSGFRILNGESVVDTTVGQLYCGSITSYPYFEGQASVEHDGITYNSEVYTKRQVFKLSDFINIQKDDKIQLLGQNGEFRLVGNDGYFELEKNHLNYINPQTRQKAESINLVVINPPSANITDTYYDTLHYLQKGEKVLVVLLNGLSYSQYENSLKEGYTPFFKNNISAIKSMGVYPLENNVWQAAMLTGQSPMENTVNSNKQKSIKGETIFDYVNKQSKKAIMLGKDKGLNLDGFQVVSDENNNGTTDDDIFKKLIESIDENYDFMVVQFDSIKESNDKYGEQSIETKNAISQMDNYLSEICSKWNGKIIITGLNYNSDNKQNLQDKLFVPYLVISSK